MSFGHLTRSDITGSSAKFIFSFLRFLLMVLLLCLLYCFPCSFLTRLIWVIPFFCLVSWSKHLSTLFIFLRKQLLESVILCIICFVSVSLISTLIFIISCHLLGLGFVCSYFSKFLICIIK